MKHIILLLALMSGINAIETGTLLITSNEHATHIPSISKEIEINRLVSYTYSRTYEKVYASYRDGSLKVIDLHAGEMQTLIKGEPIYALALSSDETRLIAGVKDGGIVIIDLLHGNKITKFAADVWVNRVFFSHDDQKIIALQNLGRTGKKNILIWGTKNLDRPERRIVSTGSIQKIAIRQNTIWALIVEEASPKIEKVRYFDIESGTLQKYSEVDCSFEKMTDGRHFKSTGEIKRCDNVSPITDTLAALGFSREVKSLSKTHPMQYENLHWHFMNDIFKISSESFFAKHEDHYLALFDAERKRGIYFYALKDDEWIMITPEGYFNASENARQYLMQKSESGVVKPIDETTYQKYKKAIDF